MLSKRQLFLNHVAQTSELPLMLEVDHAEGMFIFDMEGKAYMDMNSGISVSSLGHRHPEVIEAIKAQLDKHLHTMVYGEHIQNPQVEYAQLLCEHLARSLNSVYYVMTGTEAVELSMKLSRKYTGRTEIIAAKNSYHGSTYGSESLRSDFDFIKHFAPGVPGIRHISFNSNDELEKITEKTACIILEPIQAEAGVISPKRDWLKAVSKRCKETGTLLVLDEIQTGFGRTGELFAHQKYGIIPDILLIAKSMGGGMPIGAIVSSKTILNSLTKKPALGHITTFGGHPVSCAAALASLKVLLEYEIHEKVRYKAAFLAKHLVHPIIKEVRYDGLMMAVELTKRKYLKHVVNHCFENGLIMDYFLFNDRSFRLAPPLIITEEQIEIASDIILGAMNYAMDKYKR